MSGKIHMMAALILNSIHAFLLMLRLLAGIECFGEVFLELQYEEVE